MRIGLATFFGCMVCASGCSPTSNYVGSAEKAVSGTLKDPSSATFTDEFVVSKPAPNKMGGEQIAVCGMVNGQNSFGAYSGATRFVVTEFEDKKLNTFDVTTPNIEDDSNKRATVGTANGPSPTSIFEEVYWNGDCVDDTHPATHTGTTDENHQD